MSFDYRSLVTDRTAADAAARNTKGTYNAVDLNRVTAAMEDLNERLTGYGYSTGYQRVVIARQDGTGGARWREDNEPAYTQMERYRSNVEALRSTLAAMASTPKTPESMAALTWAKANDIEQILADVDVLIGKMESSWYFSGDMYAGEV